MLQWPADETKESEIEAPLLNAAPLGRLIFMVEPDAFDVLDAINPHMKTADGQLQIVDRIVARSQWLALIETYRKLGFKVDVLKTDPDCPDMVFCANQTFPFLEADGSPAVILSNMAVDARHREVAVLRKQLEERGVRCHELPARSPQTLFEGMGDATWIPGRPLICGGYGFRTSPRVYEKVQAITGASVVLFELIHPKFYHLDTCLCVLDGQTALACREGFTSSGWKDLAEIFPTLIEVPLLEADAPGFACNAHCPDGKHVILEKGNSFTCDALVRNGFIPLEVETNEFIKSGGSVFCMKLQCLWDHWPVQI